MEVSKKDLASVAPKAAPASSSTPAAASSAPKSVSTPAASSSGIVKLLFTLIIHYSFLY